MSVMVRDRMRVLEHGPEAQTTKPQVGSSSLLSIPPLRLRRGARQPGLADKVSFSSSNTLEAP